MLLLGFLLLNLVHVLAQQNLSLSGAVKDRKNIGLPGVGVYVSGYKIATVSDHTGAYTLSLKPGNYDILFQSIGYKAINRNVVIADKPVKLDIVLEESTTQLSEVTIKPDPNRDRYVNLFRDFFLGTTTNARLCTILNPEILQIDYDKETGTLRVKTDDFLIIENKALGYRIKYLVNDFLYDYNQKIIFYEGYPYYEELEGSKSRKKKWVQKRLEAYNGSAQHFFTALYHNRLTEEGFIIHKLIRRENTQRPSDSLINANIKRLTSRQIAQKNTFTIGKDDSLSYWLQKRKIPKNITTLDRSVVQPDTLLHEHSVSIKKIDFTEVLYIIYTKEKEDPAYRNQSGFSISRPHDIPDYQISLINLQIRPVYFYANGTVYNPRSMLYEGYWGWEKVADSVPIDYEPPAPDQNN